MALFMKCDANKFNELFNWIIIQQGHSVRLYNQQDYLFVIQLDYCVIQRNF